jgi:acyl-homoserine-lactone acylase
VTVSLMEEPVKALMQSYGRTKAKNIAEYRKVLDLHANSSNTTLYADADGNIAAFYTDFVPKRDPKFTWTRAVDGSDPATDWKGVHSFDELPNAVNPASGYVYNANDYPWDAAGKGSIDSTKFAPYIEESRSQSARGIHALRVLDGKKGFTIDKMITDVAYDSYQPGFANSIPPLVAAWDQLPDTSALKRKTAEHIAMLRKWDYRWGVGSIENSLAVYFSQAGGGGGRRGGGGGTATAAQLVQRLATASDTLTSHFGTWKTPWGNINRFQRNDANIVQVFDDNKPSIPVGFSSATWGSLASFGARTYPGTKKMYGTSGNSFVAVVEFGKDSVRARAVTAGGESGDPKSKHFNDQAERYATGNLRPVYFYPGQLVGHTERTYRPGQ